MDSISVSDNINLGIILSLVSKILFAMLLIWFCKISILKLILVMYWTKFISLGLSLLVLYILLL